MAKPKVVVFDYGFGNVRSAVRALEKVGAEVELTADSGDSLDADGLVVPGVGAFAACMNGLLNVDTNTTLRNYQGDGIIWNRIDLGLRVLGICVGMQVLFENGIEHGLDTKGLDYWPGTVEKLDAPIVPHMGWSKVSVPDNSKLFAGIEDERFYFVHSYGVTKPPEWPPGIINRVAQKFGVEPKPRKFDGLVTWSDAGDAHTSVPFVAAVEDGPLSGVQFHPEKSGEAGLALLKNWLGTL
jgi:imidazole glycerol-phosphate synthase subunit HisH